MIVVFIGPPGSGKGTQAKKLAAERGWPHLSTGDMLRSSISQGTKLGQDAKSFMDRGALVPDVVVVDLIAERTNRADCQGGFILDGFPRNIEQARALDQMLTTQKRKIDKSILFDIRDEDLIRRLSGRRSCVKCGTMYHLDFAPAKKHGICDQCGSQLAQRDDDQPEVIRKRLSIYHDQTEPLVDYFLRQGVLTRINASQAPSDVARQVSQILE